MTEGVSVEAVLLEHSLDQHDVSLGLADLLHAATARANEAIVVTCDASDFDKRLIHHLLDIDIIEHSATNP